MSDCNSSPESQFATFHLTLKKFAQILSIQSCRAPKYKQFLFNSIHYSRDNTQQSSFFKIPSLDFKAVDKLISK